MANQPQLLEEIDHLLIAINRQGLAYIMWRSIEAFGGLILAIIGGLLIGRYLTDVWSLSGIGKSIASFILLLVIPGGVFAVIVRWQQRRMDGLRAMNEYGKLIQELHVVRKEVVDGGLSRQGALKSIRGILVEHRNFIAIAAIPIPPIFVPTVVSKE